MKPNKPTTEQSSNYSDLEKMSTLDLLTNMNTEDASVPSILKQAIPTIEKAVDAIVKKMENGGRLFYLGAGTSGRLGVLDASECPPTFGVSPDLIIGLIAGGDTALRNAVENAEDDINQGWKDLLAFNINEKDVLLGIAASGTTPFVIAALRMAQTKGVITACICCNANSPLSKVANHAIELVVGPEFITGSTRLKAGTAQKLALNMISSSVMIKLGKIKGNKMIDMQLSNNKLVERGIKMIMEELQISEQKAEELLEKHKSVRAVLKNYS